MRTTHLALGLLTTIALSFTTLPGKAQSWPTQVVKIITPFPPGSGGDVTARPFAERLAERWGKPVIVENRPGADGIIAATAVLNSNDGHTLLYTNGGPLTSNLLAHAGSLPYNPDDLLPVAAAAEVYVAIAVPASLATSSLSEFVAQARLKRGQFNWSGTPGSLDYLVPGFLKRAGIDLPRVPYREVSMAMQDLSQDRLQFYAAALATQLPMAQTGKIKIIAITNSQRSPFLPDVPTARESGFPELEYEAFLGFFAPRGMSVELRERIGADLHAIGADADLAGRFSAIGMRVRVTSPAELQKIVMNERAALARYTQAAPR
ncbi:tripartite tricarboxylate transporter substrate binding protein [Bradyrhizobium diazoefficiens]|nr:tripartite tricarboxylate transporter substrate binding protein [Bradyrhizobium diazoefficiens]MBR0703797.1 tripartite tricarboxylate transporter substrate binding protein [Bradyrhizobium diazoefficiens]MBR0772553.1 tripartite tricarboxylate transporter substrate binding protein [Bradyrhizobium diazoefficiens]